MKEEKKTFLRKVRRWVVIQKLKVARGYLDIQQIMLGVIFSSSVKVWFPTIFKTWWSFALLVLGSMIILYIVGHYDIKFKIIHTENQVGSEWNPFWVQMDKKIGEKIK